LAQRESGKQNCSGCGQTRSAALGALTAGVYTPSPKAESSRAARQTFSWFAVVFFNIDGDFRVIASCNRCKLGLKQHATQAAPNSVCTLQKYLTTFLLA